LKTPGITKRILDDPFLWGEDDDYADQDDYNDEIYAKMLEEEEGGLGDNMNLLSTIKVPKNLALLSSSLPKSNYRAASSATLDSIK
jgi:hypothetical protein